MKKITMICMAAMLLLAASCKKEKEEINEPTGEESVFRVETEVHSGDSKTHIEGTYVVWDNTDAINVINGSGTSHEFTFSKYVNQGDKTVAEFETENLPAGFYTPNYTGYYPATIGDDGSFTMEQSQTYAAGSFASGVNPMVALNATDKHLKFTNSCGVLKLQLRSNEEVIVEKIIVRSKKSGEKLWGNGSINSEGVFTVTSGGSNTIELDCSQADPAVTLSTDAAHPSTFFIVLPVGTLSNGFEVEVIDKDSHGNWTVGTTKDNTIIRSHILQMPVCTVKIGVQLYAGGPYWATCNLGATSPTRYGDYYAWAETEPYYTSLTWNPAGTTPTVVGWKSGKNNGYCWKSYPNNSGTTGDSGFKEWDPVPFDGDYNLLPQYDAANQYAWEADEGTWYIPTASEFETMIANTSHTYTSNYKGTGIAGRIYKGTTTGYTDRSIFLPLAGYFENTSYKASGSEANYTTATRYSSKAYRSHYYSDHKWHNWENDYLHRYFGETIRPVKR